MTTPTVTTRELGLFLDTVSNAQLPLRSVPQISDILARLVGLANTNRTCLIGEIDPLQASPTPAPVGSVDVPT